METSTQVL